MEKFYFEVPSIKRKAEAIDYIEEHYKNDSNINGSGGLHRFLDDYEGWLEKLEKDYNMVPNEERVPARTYFLIRENDNRIIGMINIRTALNERLSKFGGHIGYGIRPSERGKGYNKINLYLGLKVCKEYGIDFLYRDFRVGFWEGHNKAKELGLYMQKYCGCVFSEEERYQKQIEKDKNIFCSM